MPLDNYITKPDFSRQIKQYANTIATLSGQTNILEKFSVKSIEIDTAGANDGDALIYDLISNKFSSNVPGSLGSRVINGLILTYNSGLTYNVSQGTYRINSILYGYTGGTINITSGLTSGSRFDVVFITSAATALVSAGTTSLNPSIPQINISGGELQVGIILVVPSFTGGVGTTIIQSTGSTFEFNSAAASAGIQRQGGVGAAATGDYSFASNFQAKASGNYSSAIGYYAEATGTSQTVVGQFNTPDEGYFIVGNGESIGSRSNAFRVTTGGSVYIQNKVFVTNVEIETTGASSNYALIHDGNKFTPQLLTLQKITESGNTTNNSIKVGQISATSIFLSSGFTFISGYNSYSNPSELRVLLADDLGGIESKTDTYQLNYFTENVTKGINPLTRGVYSAFTASTSFGYVRTGTSITVGKESFVKITGITSGDTAIGTVFRNRFETKDYEATNTLDNTTKNIVGTAFFNQINSSKFNQAPVVGTLIETHLLGNQERTYHNEVRNLQLGVFNRAWVYTTSAQTYFDLYINRPLLNNSGYNSYDNNNPNYTLRINKHAGIFIESREKISSDDVLNRPLNIIGNPTPVIFENKPWSLFAEADRGYIGSTLILASGLTLTSTTRGAWLDIGASQATRPHINFSAGTDPSSPQIGDLWWNGTELYFRKDASTSVNLLSGGTGSITSGSGTTSGTSLGNGVKVLFSSDTTTLSFATLSSQTPSSLRIISSSTGVILFSATTGSGGSGGGISGLTSAGTGNISILSTITDNKLVYKTISAGTGININDVDDTLTFITNNYEYMDLSTAQAYSAFTVGQWYRIPVSSRSVTEATNYNTYGDIMLMAVDTNKLSPDGYLLAINADYQDVGDYSDVLDLDTKHGVPYYGQVVGTFAAATSDIVIYNNRHWSTNYSQYTLTDESSITGALTPLTKDYTTRNGYIIEPQKIVYDIVTDTINRMEDKRGNVFINNNNIEIFRFGDNNVKQNYVSTSQPCAIINYPILTFIGNNFKFGRIPILTDLVPSAVILYIQNCNIQDYSFTNDYQQSLYISESNIQDKKIFNTSRQFTITSSTITLPMNAQGWLYDQGIDATGGTFNGVVTAISQDNQITNYYQKFRFTNNSGSNIIFRNSTFIKTEGGLDAIITSNIYDSIEFFVSGGVAYQTDINNYV